MKRYALQIEFAALAALTALFWVANLAGWLGR
jgi:hypothetical protein